MSARSMTGFARVRRSLPEGEPVLSVKSVNHRGLDMQFHLPVELDPFESSIRETGTHDELVNHGGIYQRLHELQYVAAGADMDL